MSEDLPQLGSRAVADWFDRFNAADLPRRRAMLEALAWSAKHQGDRLRDALKGLGSMSPAVEDLIVFGMLAFFPRETRAHMLEKALPLLAELAQHTGDAEHDKHHALIRNVVDRIDRSLEEDDGRPHPFAGVKLEGDSG